MKRLRGRTAITLLLTAALAAGLVLFCVRLVAHGGEWVGFFGTTYYDAGALYDANGVLLYDGETGSYAEDQATRMATLHLVGDRNFGTSLRSVLSSRLSGYNPITGTTLGSHDVMLTIDSALNRTALEALGGSRGVVAVYNYVTGDVKCLVSSPTYDPNDPPADVNENPAYEGVYLNRFFSGTYPPGSTFKLVTTAAAIEKKGDLDNFRFTCTGSTQIGDGVVTCPYAHGTDMTLDQCLACSCNGAYAVLALELGANELDKYMKEAGLQDSLTVDGLHTARGSFDKAEAGSVWLGWSGVGQYNDLVNPCTLLTFMGGIANRGVAVTPELVGREAISGTQIPAALSGGPDTFNIYSSSTCDRLKAIMRNNVVSSYGQEQFGDLPVCANSGTAELGGGQQPHAWFAGFVDDPNHPLAFVVLVENGGWGSQTAGGVAAKVLTQAAAG